MAQITGGLVSVEDGLKKQEEYAPPRKVRVDLTFTVSEGENYEAVFDRASEAATNRVHALLHGTALRVVSNPDQAAPAASAEGSSNKPQPRKRRTNAQIEADEAAARAAKRAPTAIELDEEPALEDQVDEPADDTGDDLSEFDVPVETAAVEAVSDADLNNAVQRKNGEINDPGRIRELIGSYNPDPTKVFQLRQIPVAKRAEFLTKLAGLKKAG